MDDRSSNRRIKAETTELESKGHHMLDSMSKGWTDEKHMLYLSSMEASFVDQLYNKEDHFIDLLGCSRRSQNRAAASTNGNHLLPSKFKVLRRGCWENLEFGRTKDRLGNENESCQSANPWLHHFRSCSTGKDGAVKTVRKGDKLASQSILAESRRHGRETSCSTKILACPQTNHQDLIDWTTEVSDQNFVNEEVKEEAESSRVIKKRRSLPAANMAADQVVPSGKSLVEPSYESRDRGVEMAIAPSSRYRA